MEEKEICTCPKCPECKVCSICKPTKNTFIEELKKLACWNKLTVAERSDLEFFMMSAIQHGRDEAVDSFQHRWKAASKGIGLLNMDEVLEQARKGKDDEMDKSIKRYEQARADGTLDKHFPKL